MLTIIAMDGQGNVSFGDGQLFEPEAAKAEADRRNRAAERSGSDWFYMTSPSMED
ncbi:MAG TPA: hypothetical protein VLC51_01200 [Nitrospira sp.]|nr:hypothetical protein [Nitrospira sp.]